MCALLCDVTCRLPNPSLPRYNWATPAAVADESGSPRPSGRWDTQSLHTVTTHSTQSLHTISIHSSRSLHTVTTHSTHLLHTIAIHSFKSLHIDTTRSTQSLHTPTTHSTLSLHTIDIYNCRSLHTLTIHSTQSLHSIAIHSRSHCTLTPHAAHIRHIECMNECESLINLFKIILYIQFFHG